MQPNALGFVRKSRVEGLAALKPSDGRFLAVQLSEDSVPPPTDEAIEEIAELRREACTCYNEADNEHGFAVAQLLIDNASAKNLQYPLRRKRGSAGPHKAKISPHGA